MRHPSQMRTGESGISAKSRDTYIRLKSGVSLTQRAVGFALGLPTRALLLNEPLHAQIISAFKSERGSQEIARSLLCEVEEVNALAEQIIEAGFADEVTAFSSSKSLDLSESIISVRTAIERSLIAHRSGVRDGGAKEFEGRESTTILISGENRLARHLLVALQASGFSQTRLIARAHQSPRINGSDLCGTVVRSGDIGKLRSEFTAELIRGSAISRSELLAKPNPDLIISTIPIEWDYVQRWMSEGSTHLHINQLIGPEIEVGPLVIPGATPCLRCVALSKKESAGSEFHQSSRSEMPSAAGSFIAGLIALSLCEYFATGQSPLRSSSQWYDLLNPLRPPEVRHWNFHPVCGCR